MQVTHDLKKYTWNEEYTTEVFVSYKLLWFIGFIY